MYDEKERAQIILQFQADAGIELTLSATANKGTYEGLLKALPKNAAREGDVDTLFLSLSVQLNDVEVTLGPVEGKPSALEAPVTGMAKALRLTQKLQLPVQLWGSPQGMLHARFREIFDITAGQLPDDVMRELHLRNMRLGYPVPASLWGENARVCQGCGAIFIPRRKDARYHSDDCRRADMMRRHRERRKTLTPA